MHKFGKLVLAEMLPLPVSCVKNAPFFLEYRSFYTLYIV